MTTEAETAWAAGLFEGEGCISVHRGRRKGGVLIVRMTDLDVLERFAGIVDCGGIRGPIAPSKPNHKPSYEWRCAVWSDIERVLWSFLPWLGARRNAKMADLLSQPVGAKGREGQTHCKRQHPLTGPEANVLVTATGSRRCRECDRARRIARDLIERNPDWQDAIETRRLRAA